MTLACVFDRPRAGSPSSQNRGACWALPLWLLSTSFSPAVPADLQAFTQGGCLIAFICVGLRYGGWRFLIGPCFRESVILATLSLLYFLAASASALNSVDPGWSFAMTIALSLGYYACGGVWEICGPYMSLCLRRFAVFGTTINLLIYALTSQAGERFGGILHPNNWGLICFGQALCSLLIRRVWLRWTVLAANLFIIMQAQSRAALLALAIALSLYYVRYLQTALRRGRVRSLLSVITLSVALAAVIYQLDEFSTFGKVLLALNDSDRGVNSGFSGRTDLWAKGIDLIAQNPLLGIGTRMQDRYYQDATTGVKSVHNGYLGLLIENGVLGAFCLFPIIIIGIWRLFRAARDRQTVPYIGSLLLIGYLFIACFEPRLLNVGNPTSVLVILVILDPSHGQIVPRLRPVRYSQHRLIPELRLRQAS